MNTLNVSDELPLARDLPPGRPLSLKVIGLGGAGLGIVRRLHAENLPDLALAVVDTDRAALAASPVTNQTLLGVSLTHGLGTGGDVALGRETAVADPEKLTALVRNCDLVFIVGGLGGGTGAGVAPLLAEAASRAGALVLAFVTQPFSFLRVRQPATEHGLPALRAACDAVFLLPNDLLFQATDAQEDARLAYARAEEWIGRAVRSVGALLLRPGLMPLDLPKLQSAFATRGGLTLFGLGSGAGSNAVADAIASLGLCPLLASPECARKADRLLVSIVGGPVLSLEGVRILMEAVAAQFGRDPLLIPGAAIDDLMSDRVEIVVLGTCDPGGRRAAPRRATPRERAAATAPAAAGSQPAPTATAQNEFAFGSEPESRGYFDSTERYLHQGHDLDLPTYQRKGIKIVL